MSFLWGNTSNQPPDPKKFANISNDQINSNQQALPVKYLAGRAYVAGDYISPAYNPRAVPIKTQTGKSESSTTGYKYYADFALMFCTGGRHPVDSVHKVIVDSDIRWSGTISRGHEDKKVITVEGLGLIHLYWGTESQLIDSVLLQPRGTAGAGVDPNDSTTWPAAAPGPGVPVYQGLPGGNPNPYSGHYDRHPAYRGQCYGVFKDWKLGRDRTSIQNIQLELKRGCPWIGGMHVASTDSGVNPIAVLYDWLTDPRFGMGLSDSFLDSAIWQAAFNQLNSIGIKINPLITQQSDFRQMVAELLEYFDGWIRRSGTKIQVGRWASGADVVSSAILLDDDLLQEPALEPQGWGPTINEVTVVYKDKDHHFNDYVQNYRDPNNFRITGGPRPTTLQRPWITDAATAKGYARSVGAAMALPFTRGNLVVRREWLTNKSMLPGKVFTYNSGFYGLSFLMRLLEVEHSADSSASATLTVEWERSKWPSIYIPPPFQGGGGFKIGPRAIWKSRIAEIPYLMEDQRFDTQIVPLAVRGNVEVQGFRVWLSLDGGLTYQIVPDQSSSSAFSAYGRLYSGNAGLGLVPTDTAMGFNLYGIGLDEIVSQNNQQWRNDNLLCFIEGEVVSCGRIVTNTQSFRTCYILRERYGTTSPALHPQNTDMYFIFRDRMKIIDNAGFTPGTVIKIKLQPFTADSDYDLGAITPITYTITGFDDIPAPVLSPSPGTFVTSAVISCSAPPSGMKIRYTSDGTPVSGTSREWPKSGANYTTQTITSSTTFRVRVYADSGRVSPETIAAYVKVTQSPGAQCGAPNWSFSGILNHTSGNVTLTITTTGSTIKYKKNNGAIQTYSSPVALACVTHGDYLEFWAIKPGLEDSAHRYIDNSLETTYGGGGHNPPHPPP